MTIFTTLLCSGQQVLLKLRCLLLCFPEPSGGILQLKIRGGGGWLDSLGSEILVEKDILGFFKNIDLDNS